MEILMLVKTKNAGQFNAIFENNEDFKEFLLEVLKHLQKLLNENPVIL